MSMRAQVPALIAEYFERVDAPADHPIIVQSYRPDRGWRTYPIAKRVSVSWLRKMRAEGWTAVAVEAGGRRADFTIREVIAYAGRPMFGGRVI